MINLEILNLMDAKWSNIQHDIQIIESDLQDLLPEAHQPIQIVPLGVNPEWQVKTK